MLANYSISFLTFVTKQIESKLSMLLLPDKGIRVSSSHHNVELDIFCDWIEGCVLFGELPLSTTDFIDVLLENNVYRDQDFAAQLLENAWAELHRRNRCIGETSFYDLQGKRITPLQSWKQAPAYSFCLLLSLVKAYSAWSTQNGNTGYTEQGELFELLTKESLEIQLTGWHIQQMGWSRGNPKSLRETVDEILDLLGERVGDVETWASRTAKDYGLDLLCFKPFVDGRAGVPVYLLQCASRQNWQTKVLTPDLNMWTKIVVFAARPRKAFAIPFALLDEDFHRNCGSVDGLLLDRCRLLAAGDRGEDWLSAGLQERLVEWIEPRASTIPRGER